MKKTMSMQIKVLSLLIASLMFGVINASAGRPPADLDVKISGPASAFVYSPYVYTVDVKNIGGRDANGVTLSVDLPLTDTSPTQHILGNLSGIDSSCNLVGNKLECNLGRIRKNRTESITFNFALPVSTKTLEIKATVPNNYGESNLSNNTDVIVSPLSYPSNTITSANILNSHCTGQNLTSYFECELFPSSITQHTATLNSNGMIIFSQPGYTGNWYQVTPEQLHMDYSDGTNTVLEFNGFATSASCFEGVSTFPNSSYVSPYKVCIQ